MRRFGLALAMVWMCALAAACGSGSEDGNSVPCGPSTCTSAEYCCSTTTGQCAPTGVTCPDPS